jgi:hypothetical protein
VLLRQCERLSTVSATGGSLISVLIGKAGATIKAIKEASGASVDLVKP